MPKLLDKLFKVTGAKKTRYYIETGTYRGDGVREVLNDYENIISIELSEKWYQHNVEQFKDQSHVKILHGDSGRVLPVILKDIQEPVTVYLDAHFAGKFTAHGDEDTPLLAELEVLMSREYDDIIIIDDIRMLGKSGICGMSPDDPIYPTMYYDWRDVTVDAIKKRCKPGYVMIPNSENLVAGSTDRLIMAPLLK